MMNKYNNYQYWFKTEPKIKMPNIKVKILQQLLSQAIEEFKKVNKIKAISFSERMKSIVDTYNLRSMDDAEI